MNDMNDSPLIDKPKRNPNKWNKNKGGDKWANKAKKQYKNRERELYEDSLDEDTREYR